MDVLIPRSIPKKRFFRDLYKEISDDNVSNGAAALSYYFFFALFPAMIFFISLVPYLPIDNVHQAVMDLTRQVLPGEASKLFEGAIAEVTQNQRGSLVSIGAVLTLWAASAGMYALMQQLNITYDVLESRPFWKARGLSMLLTIAFAVLLLVGFGLIVFGGLMQSWLGERFDIGSIGLAAFAVFRWVVIFAMLLFGFAMVYYFAPDVDQEFKYITPGSVIAVAILSAATLGFRYYVENFVNYAATYGSIGAVIILMLLLYITGLVILLGSEINALIEHYSVQGKDKGERSPGHPAPRRRAVPPPRSLRPQPAPRTQGSFRWSTVPLALLTILMGSFGRAKPSRAARART